MNRVPIHAVTQEALAKWRGIQLLNEVLRLRFALSHIENRAVSFAEAKVIAADALAVTTPED